MNTTIYNDDGFEYEGNEAGFIAIVRDQPAGHPDWCNCHGCNPIRDLRQPPTKKIELTDTGLPADPEFQVYVRKAISTLEYYANDKGRDGASR